MKVKQKLHRFLCILLVCMMMLNAPMSVLAVDAAVEAELPFTLTVGGEKMTEFEIGEVADPYNGTKDLYTVTIPEGSTEAVITWTEGTYTLSYYDGNTNAYLGFGSGFAASHTVPTDYNNDGVYDKIQVYDSGYDVPYWIAFTSESVENEDTTYNVNVNDTENGTVTADPITAAAGTEVTLTVTPDEGFELDTLTVKNGEEEVTVTDNKFTMPEGNVTVSATFKVIETSEAKAVTIYMSVNKNGKFITATNDTVMALEEMTVPYFDLEVYGLEGLYYNPYCYVDQNGNTVTQTAGTKEDAENVVTLLHLFIWATEVYYNELDPAEAGQGWLAENGWNGFNVYDPTPGSAFINFWTFGSNLNYYLNYEYPLGRPGWGSTCDQIALADGDIVSVRYNAATGNDGAYYHFGSTGDLSKSTTQVNDVVLTMYQCTEDSLKYTTGHARVGEGKTVYVGPTVNPTDAVATYTTDVNSQITVETSELEGSYYVFSDTWDPAVMYLKVTAASHIHNYTAVVTEPTCEEGGYTTYTCSCGDSYESDFVDAKGHNFVDGVCSCGEKETVIPEGARFINVTTDVTGATIVEDQGIYHDYAKIPYYHLVIPENAKYVYITYPENSIIIDQWSYTMAYAMPLPYSAGNMGSNMSPAVKTNADGTCTVSILVKDYITQIPDDGTGIIMYNENFEWGEMFTIGYQIEAGYYDVSIPSSERYTVTAETIAKDGYTFNVSINEGYVAGEEFAVKVNGETVATKPGDVTVASVTERLIITVEGVLLEPKDPNCFITVDLTGYNGTIDSNSSICYEGPDIEWTYDKNHGLVPGESKTYQFHSDEMYHFSIVLDLPYNDGAILGWEVNGEQCLYTGSYKQYDLPAEGNDDAVGYMQRINYTWDGVTYDYLQFECRFGKSGDINAPGTWVLKPILTPEGYITNMINALPAIDQLTAADAEKVEAARAAYDALTEEQKALVSEEVEAALEAAEAKIAELKKAEAIEKAKEAAEEAAARAEAAQKAAEEAAAKAEADKADAQKVLEEAAKKLEAAEAAQKAAEEAATKAEANKTLTEADKIAIQSALGEIDKKLEAAEAAQKAAEAAAAKAEAAQKAIEEASAKPAATKITSIKKAKKKLTIKWKKVSGADGYVIYRSTKKNGTYKKVKTIKKATTVKWTNKKLKSNKRYYYKVRAYKVVNGKKVYSKYSAVKSAKTK